MESNRPITRMKQMEAILRLSVHKTKRISKLQRAQNLVRINEISQLIQQVKVINQEGLVHLRICYYQVSHHRTTNDLTSKLNSIRKWTLTQDHAGKATWAKNWTDVPLKMEGTGRASNWLNHLRKWCRTKFHHLQPNHKIQSLLSARPGLKNRFGLDRGHWSTVI